MTLPPPFDIILFVLPGLWLTIQITFVAALLGLLLSILVGIGRVSKYFALRLPLTIYVEIFRGTSLLVQIFYFYFVLPVIGLSMNPFWAGVLAVAMNAGAYGSEIVRGALTAVDRGQRDAIIALNLGPLRSFLRIILPQAAIRMILPFGNLLIELLKSTPLLSLIAISDLLYRGHMYVSLTGRTTEIFTALLVLYFLLGWPLVKGIGAFHAYMSRGVGHDV